MYYRQALEYREAELRVSALEKAMNVAVTEGAKSWVLKELDGNDGDGEGQGRGGSVVDGVKVPVVRLNLGEIAEATVVAVLPVCGAGDRGKWVEEAPWECGPKGDFGIVEAEKDWGRWVVLPAWEPVMRVKRGGVAVAFDDARALPWRVNRWYKEESILVVVDRERKEVEFDDGFYLYLTEDELKVERGSVLKEKSVSASLGTVVIVVRPPREDEENEIAVRSDLKIRLELNLFNTKPISATLIPANPPPQQKNLYQPFRPPPSQSPIPPQYRNLDTEARLDVLSNRLGQWYEYAPLIPPLIQEGFAPPMIEEITDHVLRIFHLLKQSLITLSMYVSNPAALKLLVSFQTDINLDKCLSSDLSNGTLPILPYPQVLVCMHRIRQLLWSGSELGDDDEPPVTGRKCARDNV
nr:hypothetical protein [Tanacetum cinerariifolium]